MRSHVSRVVRHAGELGPALLELAASACGNEVTELMFGFPSDDSPPRQAVYKGRCMKGVFAAEPLPEGAFDRSSRAFRLGHT